MSSIFESSPMDVENPSEEEITRAREGYSDKEQQESELRGEKRLPVEFILDTSSSMGENGKIDELNEGIKTFIDTLLNNEMTNTAVDIGVITMGGRQPEIAAPLETIYNYDSRHVYAASGITPMGDALQLSATEITARKLFYRDNVLDYYRPLIFLLSDGCPTDHEGYPIQDERILQEYENFVSEITDKKRALFYTFYIGTDEREKEIMRRLASTLDGITYAYTLKEEKGNLKRLFEYLSNSITQEFNKISRKENEDRRDAITFI